MVIIMYDDEQFDVKLSGYWKTKSPRSRQTLTLNNSTRIHPISMYYSSLDRVKKGLSKHGIDSQVI